MNNKKTGVELIAEERQRQIEVEGWTAEHDAEHLNGEIAAAAGCYALWCWSNTDAQRLWPWDKKWLKAETCSNETIEQKITRMKKVGALAAAEIDRLQKIKQ